MFESTSNSLAIINERFGLRRRIPWFFCILSGLYIFVVTQNFPLGFTPDSIEYYDVALSLSRGQGFVDSQGQFVNHWPPGYPLMIATLSWLTGSSIQLSAIILSALASGLIFLIFNKLMVLSKVRLIIQILLNLVLFVTFLNTVPLWFESETVFTLFVLVLVWITYLWQDSPSLPKLIGVSVFLGLMFLTRYAAIGFVLGTVLVVIHHGLSQRAEGFPSVMKNILLLSCSVSFTILPWYFVSRLNQKEMTNRDIKVNIIGKDHLRQMGDTFSNWINPSGNWLMWYVLFLSLALVAAFIISKKPRFNRVSMITGAMIVTYFFFLFVSISFVDHTTPLDNRLLSPVLPLILVLIAIPNFSKTKDYLPISVFFTIVLLANSNSFLHAGLAFRAQGRGYTSIWWEDSEVLSYVSGQNCNTIYTNNYYAFRLYRPELVSKLRGISQLDTNYLDLPDNSCVAWISTHAPNNINGNLLSTMDKLEKVVLKDGWVLK